MDIIIWEELLHFKSLLYLIPSNFYSFQWDCETLAPTPTLHRTLQVDTTTRRVLLLLD